MANEICLWLLFGIGGFLSGSVMYSELLPRILQRKDIVQVSDDHNPGAYNVFKHCGAGLGIPCVLLDMLKGFVPVFLAGYFLPVTDFLFSLVIAAPVFGHAVGMLNRFRGGKCIATSFGVMAGLLPFTRIVFLLAALYILFSAAIRIRSDSRKSILVFFLFGVGSMAILCVEKLYAVGFGCLFVALIADFKHILPVWRAKRQKLRSEE